MMKTHYNFTAQIEKDKETGLYIGLVPGLPGAYTQAMSLDELQSNLKEVIELWPGELSPDELDDLSEFVGIQHISVNVWVNYFENLCIFEILYSGSIHMGFPLKMV